MADLFHPTVFAFDYRGMNYFVEFLNASRLSRAGIAEGGLREARAVDGSVWIENFAAKMANDLVVDGLSGLHEFVGDGIGLDQVRSSPHEHLAYDGFAGGKAASEANLEQGETFGSQK